VEAPEGTAARPKISFSKKTSTSIVGFALESNRKKDLYESI
jgi:hypothetical protein